MDASTGTAGALTPVIEGRSPLLHAERWASRFRPWVAGATVPRYPTPNTPPPGRRSPPMSLLMVLMHIYGNTTRRRPAGPRRVA